MLIIYTIQKFRNSSQGYKRKKFRCLTFTYFFFQEKDAFWSMASGILNKAKPKVEPPPMPAKEEAAPADKAADGQPQQDATPNGEPAPPGKEMDQMDVE